MSDGCSALQKLCLQTIKSGAINAFTDMFRLTHLVQPLSANQPYTFEDIIATAGPDAPQLIPEFAFDNPLSMPIKTLSKLQKLFETSDNYGLQKQLYEKFVALSKISDLFLDNHKLRLKVKMNPLVMPYAVYQNLQTTYSGDVLQLIDNQEFTRTVEAENALVYAIAQVRNEPLEQQIFVPVVINYALQARNVLFEYICKEMKDQRCDYLYELMDKPISQAVLDSNSEVSQIMQLRFTLLLLSCFLRLAYSLNQFSLYKASYVVFKKFLQCTERLEELLGGRFSEHFAATNENGYLRFLDDDHVNLNKDKKDDNLAYANLEVAGIPRIFDCILDRAEIFNDWAVELGEFKVVRATQPALRDASQGAAQNAAGDGLALAEFVYAGRIYAIYNQLLLGCQVFSQQKDAGVTLPGIQAIDDIIRRPACEGDGKSGQELLTVEQLSEPKLNFPLLCSYRQLLEATALFQEATENALKFDVFCMKIPAFKRLCELASRLERYEIAEHYAEYLLLAGSIFSINALAWKARWARQTGSAGERYEYLKQRYETATETLAATQDDTSLLAQQKQLLATKYAVSAASELTFASANNEGLMEDAWNSLQQQNSEAEQMGNTVIEARVRYGAVKGKESVDRVLGSAVREDVEEGHDEDLDACLLAAE